MKRVIAFLLVCVMVCSLMAACGNKGGGTQTEGTKGTQDTGKETEEQTQSTKNVTLNVITSFAGEDGNAKNFQNAVKDWEAATGNTISDGSAVIDETVKSRVVTDFQTGSEPDVLFYFTGVDANSFIEADKVVPIEEIRTVYPDYAANMKDDMFAESPADGVKYSVPVFGYWEAMFVNTVVLEAAGVEVPGADYTWEQFLTDCQKIKDAGYIPIASALGNVPHYWFEYSIFNQQGPDKQTNLPGSADDADGQAWQAGIEDVKELYEKGFFPENTLSARDEETVQMFINDKAAFLLDGSWKVNGIANNCQDDPEDPETLDAEKLDTFTVTYVPGSSARESTDLIGGFSMGYYITRKAWDDPDKRAAAVAFVEYMTSDEMVPIFATHTATALKQAPDVDEAQFNSLQIKAIKMIEGVTSFTPAVQDLIPNECRTPLFDGMPSLVAGEESIKDAVQECLDLMAEKAQ